MQHNKRTFITGILLAAFLWGQPAPVLSATKDDLQKIEQDIQRSRQKSQELETKSFSLKQDVQALRAELIALSQSVQQREAGVTRLEIAIADLMIEEKQARLGLEERHGQSVETLMALQRLALNPPEAIIASPQAPSDMVRSAILLRSIVPQIQRQADALNAEVSSYERKRSLLEAQKKKLSLANTNLDDERRRLNRLIKEKRTLSARFSKDSKREARHIANLTSKAQNLRGLLEKIEKDRKRKAAEKKRKKPAPKTQKEEDQEIVLGKPPTGKPMAKAKGKLTKPGSGRLIMRFGQKEKLGGKHRGISIKTRRSAQIVATYDGQIAFAGPFRGYKQLLIIDHGDGYHTLLTGMERIDVSVGQWLLSGEPVGVMSSNRSSDATLYFELRKKGVPINPLPWIRQQKTKAQG